MPNFLNHANLIALQLCLSLTRPASRVVAFTPADHSWFRAPIKGNR